MEPVTKIQFSEREYQLVSNPDWILTKHIIIKKVNSFFGELIDIMKKFEPSDPKVSNFLKTKNGKISKGENYEGLPYVILDYPNFFSNQNIFAIRTMFWWGNFFSITLHLKGEYFNRSKSHTDALLNYIKEKDYFLGINKNEWEHHFRPNNYKGKEFLKAMKPEDISEMEFLKIGKYFPLDQLENIQENLIKAFQELLECPAIICRN